MPASGLDQTRLKNKIKAAFSFEQNELESWNDSLERISSKIATAFIEEILEAKITVQSGIPVSTTGTASAQTGTTTADKIAIVS